MSQISSHTSIHSHSVTAAGFTWRDDPLHLTEKERELLKQGNYADGKPYQYALLTEGDETTAFALSEQIRADDPKSLIYRSVEDYKRLVGYTRFNGSGGFLIGLTNEHNRLIGMGGIEAMDDESDHGSGPVVRHKGQLNNYDQVYWKTLGLSKEARGQGHLDEFYETRMVITLQTGRPYAVMKTNNAYLIDAYTAKGWMNLTQEKHPDWTLDYEAKEANNTGKTVDVLVIEREKALNWYQENKTGLITLPDLNIASYDANPKRRLH